MTGSDKGDVRQTISDDPSQRQTKAIRPVAFTSRPPKVLSIAGSDPSGGAGIQADLKTFTSLGCYGMAALTALTAQNTQGVSDIHIVSTDFFRAQLQALWKDIDLDAIKIGMLGNQAIVQALHEELVGDAFGRYVDVPVVLDPVMVSTSGSLLLTHESVEDLIRLLLPHCTLLTPNIPEANQLLSHARKQTMKAGSLAEVMRAAQTLTQLGPQACLVKGGHQFCAQAEMDQHLAQLDGAKTAGEGETNERFLGAEVTEASWQSCRVAVVRTDREPYAEILAADAPEVGRRVVTDVLFERDPDRFTIFVKPFVSSTATHGTGCTLSSACAANLAVSGRSALRSAVFDSIHYVQRAIACGLQDFGKGKGPLNHLFDVMPRAIPLTTTTEATQGTELQVPFCSRLISHSLPLWRAFTQHPFVEQIAALTISKKAFVYFLRQDYLFLKHYARVWASGASSFSIGNSFERIGTFAGIAATMAAEAEHHVEICKPWGISREDLEGETMESAATLAYTRFVLDVSRSGDALDLLAATGPCLLGYGEAGRFMENERRRSRGKSAVADESLSRSVDHQNVDRWIDYYAGDEFQKVVRDGITNMERYASQDPPSPQRMGSLQRIWDAAVRLEIGMWDEALDESLQRSIYGP